MTTPEILQISIAALSLAGVCGVWFRLGVLTKGQDGHENRIITLETRIWKGI